MYSADNVREASVRISAKKEFCLALAYCSSKIHEGYPQNLWITLQ